MAEVYIFKKHLTDFDKEHLTIFKPKQNGNDRYIDYNI